jgi:hypothetical protein
MRRPAALLALLLVVGLAATVIALRGREGDTQLAVGQQSLAPVDAGALERLVLTTSDPRPGRGGHARSAHCAHAGGAWSCLVSYPSPPAIRYRVNVRADGAIAGSGRPEGVPGATELTIRGCCVASP